MGTISPDNRLEDRAPENGRIENTVDATTPKTKNLYNKMEWAGAFGDVGTLIPFVVAYITIVKVEPLGLLLMFGIALMASGLYYRTPLPIQPMKAIGAAAIAGGISPAALFGSGLTTGLFWLLAGVTRCGGAGLRYDVHSYTHFRVLGHREKLTTSIVIISDN